MIPTKGMTLPFISYGGSSMLAMGLTLGMALALTRRMPGAYTDSGKSGPFG
jgi:cell division protein FtsW